MAEIQSTRRAHPWRSPSYPQRVHVREARRWRDVLQHWDERIKQAHASVTGSEIEPSRHRLFAQMLGARDQIALATSRLPMQTGDLYAADRNRLEQAVAALERLFERWS